MENDIETVTLKLETYKKMESEIETLKKEVKQKTIIKEVIHPIYGYVLFTIVIGLLMFFLYKTN